MPAKGSKVGQEKAEYNWLRQRMRSHVRHLIGGINAAHKEQDVRFPRLSRTGITDLGQSSHPRSFIALPSTSRHRAHCNPPCVVPGRRTHFLQAIGSRLVEDSFHCHQVHHTHEIRPGAHRNLNTCVGTGGIEKERAGKGGRAGASKERDEVCEEVEFVSACVNVAGGKPAWIRRKAIHETSVGTQTPCVDRNLTSVRMDESRRRGFPVKRSEKKSAVEATYLQRKRKTQSSQRSLV